MAAIQRVPTELFLHIFKFCCSPTQEEDPLQPLLAFTSKPYRRVRHPQIIIISTTCRSWNEIIAAEISDTFYHTYLPLTLSDGKNILTDFAAYRRAVITSNGSHLHFAWEMRWEVLDHRQLRLALHAMNMVLCYPKQLRSIRATFRRHQSLTEHLLSLFNELDDVGSFSWVLSFDSHPSNWKTKPLKYSYYDCELAPTIPYSEVLECFATGHGGGDFLTRSMTGLSFYFMANMDKDLMWSILLKCDALSYLYLGHLDFRKSEGTTVEHPEFIHLPSLTSLQLYMVSSRAMHNLLSKLCVPRLLNLQLTANDGASLERQGFGRLELPPSLLTAAFANTGEQYTNHTDLVIALYFNARLSSPLCMKLEQYGPNRSGARCTFGFSISSPANAASKRPCNVTVAFSQYADPESALKFVSAFETRYNIELLESDAGLWMTEVTAIKERLVLYFQVARDAEKN